MNYTKLSNLLYPDVDTTLDELLSSIPKRQLENDAQVVRFSPSPTGMMHIGNFFQAYLNKIIADQTNGIFYLRIEDTDQKRLVDNAVDTILSTLQSFDVVPNEGYSYGGVYGPYRQSERLPFYHIFAKHLVSIGRAYPCFCNALSNKEELLERRKKEYTSTEIVKDSCASLSYEQIEDNINNNIPFALRLLSNGKIDRKITINDAAKGNREIGEWLTDEILIKSNGIPVYHFAHIVDDTMMGTTMVVRGEEWFSTLALHYQLFEAFGLQMPTYLHTPLLMIIDADGTKRKISKRYDPQANMSFYIENGYPIIGLKEYLLTLLNSNFERWRLSNPDTDINEYVFDITNIGSNNPMFDIVKLDNICKRYLSTIPDKDLFYDIEVWAKSFDTVLYEEMRQYPSKWEKAISIDRHGEKIRKDISHYSMISEYFDYIFTDFTVDESIVLADFDDRSKPFLTHYIESYQDFDNNTDWFEHLKSIALSNGFADNKVYKANPTDYIGSVSDAAKLIRLSITGKTNTPTLYDIINTISIPVMKDRINNIINKL